MRAGEWRAIVVVLCGGDAGHSSGGLSSVVVEGGRAARTVRALGGGWWLALTKLSRSCGVCISKSSKKAKSARNDTVLVPFGMTGERNGP